MRNHHGSAYVEAELVASQKRLVASVLTDLVRDGVQYIVAEIFEKPAVPILDGAMTALLGAVRAQAEAARLSLELVYRGVHLSTEGRWR